MRSNPQASPTPADQYDTILYFFVHTTLVIHYDRNILHCVSRPRPSLPSLIALLLPLTLRRLVYDSQKDQASGPGAYHLLPDTTVDFVFQHAILAGPKDNVVPGMLP